MKKRNIPALAILAMLGSAAGRPALAQEACKTVNLKNPAVPLADIYAMADKYAKAWQADAVPARISSTSLGPLQPDGSSTAWSLMFYSAKTDSNVSISTMRGMLTCWANKGSAGRLPDFKPNFYLDGAALYALARKHGQALLSQGYSVTLGTAAAPSDRHATWYVNFDKDNKDGGLSIVVDANTGKVDDVIKH